MACKLRLNNFKIPFSDERAQTQEALRRIKQIAQSVDGEMADHKRKIQFEEIIQNLDKTSWTRYKDRRFTRKDFLNRKLWCRFDAVLREKSRVSIVIDRCQ